jgi:cobyrinic acid a,c-diamide synthase
MEQMQLTMRHLGLIPYREGKGGTDFDERIRIVTDIIGTYVDLERVKDLMADVTPDTTHIPLFEPHGEPDVRIGVAIDEAFNFYYADLFDVLRSAGAKVVPFSPIHDRLPEADGYIIGGGYPELFLFELEANDSMRAAIREAAVNKKPVYAECGGLMYLTERIVIKKGWRGSETDCSAGMCGVFPGETRMPARRVVSYVEGTSSSSCPLGAARFRGHEFHYSDVALDPGTRYSYRLSRGIGISDTLDGATVCNTLGSYTHLHPVPCRDMFTYFVDRCRAVR